ncbi:hypothetical protein [Duganella aceris]|uniref:Uncharacterized protein n=1 Tax=Duganella aceris TaxID=2703883 RepID=A0ABX0FJ62_9BURK|nr:hypothetical protein [Duganella aceris]NGZ84575.1 hypothetical protein [Duganella aceris]
MLVVCLLNPQLAGTETGRVWYPVKVVDGRAAMYEPLARARKAWRICALLPEAARLGAQRDAACRWSI